MSKIHVPTYRRHKPSGQAVVTLAGRDHYLGPHGSAESIEKYRRLVGQDLLREVRKPADPAALTLVEMLAAYLRHAQAYYRDPDGKPTSEVEGIKRAFRQLKELYGHTPAADFGPKDLKAVRQAMVDAGYARPSINKDVARIKRLFKWSVGEELIPPAQLVGLQAVTGLRRGRTTAPEPPAVKPVPLANVEATIPHMPRQVAAMVRFQLATGCRPGEVCAVRPVDVDTTGDIWIFKPRTHKNAHRGKPRAVYVGPAAQAALAPFLARDLRAHCFSPEEVAQERYEELRRGRKSRVQPSQIERSKRRAAKRKKGRPRSAPRDHYDTPSYGKAIARACDKAWPAPDDLEGEALKAWRRDHRWSPNQLRHLAATTIRKAYGLEAAALVLGHSSAILTDQTYAERDAQKIREVIAKIG